MAPILVLHILVFFSLSTHLIQLSHFCEIGVLDIANGSSINSLIVFDFHADRDHKKETCLCI